MQNNNIIINIYEYCHYLNSCVYIFLYSFQFQVFKLSQLLLVFTFFYRFLFSICNIVIAHPLLWSISRHRLWHVSAFLNHMSASFVKTLTYVPVNMYKVRITIVWYRTLRNLEKFTFYLSSHSTYQKFSLSTLVMFKLSVIIYWRWNCSEHARPNMLFDMYLFIGMKVVQFNKRIISVCPMYSTETISTWIKPYIKQKRCCPTWITLLSS